MLKQLKIKNFTVFSQADLKFAPGLNVIVGENGCGKSHLLKLLYAISFENTSQGRKPNAQKPSKAILERVYTEKIKNVFHVSSFEELVKHIMIEAPFPSMHFGDRSGLLPINMYPLFVTLYYENKQLNTRFSYGSGGSPEVITESGDSVQFEPTHVDILTLPKEWDNIQSIFIPTRELLTIYPGFISIYENHYLEFDETYRDTCILLGSPALKGKREKQVKEMLKPLEEAMGGKVILENGRFYLGKGQGKIEIPMVAEGQRKLAMLAQLIATGALLDNGYLFWDEPESNLNPKLIKVIAKVILHLCNSGIQVFIATHSLFLLRELAILSHDNKFNSINTRYFALRLEENHNVQVEQGNSIEELQTLVLLDEELSQSDRFMRSGA